MPNRITGVTMNAFNNLQLDAGVFLINFDASSATTAAALRTSLATAIADPTKFFGATRGGGTFTATPNTRNIELDGMYYAIKRSTVLEYWDITLATTLVELGGPNFSKTLLASAESTSGNKTTIQLKNAIEDGDYITKLTWGGDLADGRVCLIELDNALNTEGVTLTIANRGEGTFPVTFKAHSSDLSTQYAPCRVVIVKDPTTP